MTLSFTSSSSGKHTVCRRVRASFSLKTLQAEAVKVLMNERQEEELCTEQWIRQEASVDLEGEEICDQTWQHDR